VTLRRLLLRRRPEPRCSYLALVSTTVNRNAGRPAIPELVDAVAAAGT